ncbi:hypothetical protein RZS08_42815, partial [Arthrospira platensis SPKY1]|nr:hypothetical protein [Arthrospira platensis SPKY1]
MGKFGQNWLVLVGFALLIALVNGLSTQFTPDGDEPTALGFVSLLVAIGFAIVSTILLIGLIRAALKITRGE